MDIDPHAIGIIQRLNESGYEACLVGGCVRDVLRGEIPEDWDIATAATPDQVHEALSDHTIIDVGIKHGTVAAYLDGRAFEITTYRQEGVYLDSRRPSEVIFVKTIEEDLARRDFTINAIAYHPSRGLIDPFGGAGDIRDHVLKAVGKPEERLTEDALRIMRALRFSAVLGFTIDTSLSQALHTTRNSLAHIAAERIRDELTKLLIGRHVLSVLLEYPDVLSVPIPEIEPCVGFEQHSVYHCFDVWTHTANAVACVKQDVLTRLALLFHDLGKPSTFSMDKNGAGHFYGHDKAGVAIAYDRLRALRFDNKTVELVTKLVNWHCPRLRMGDIPRWLNRLGEEGLRALIEVKRGDILAHSEINKQERHDRMAEFEAALDEYMAAQPCFTRTELTVNGHDLMELGFTQGPQLGYLLETLLEQVMDGVLDNKREILLDAARKYLMF